MRTLRIRVTAEHIAAAGDERYRWAVPVEEAIAELLDVDVSIDGGGIDSTCIATIGTTSAATLVVDLPPAANAWLDRRWGDEATVSPTIADGARGEPFEFDLEVVPDWLERALWPVGALHGRRVPRREGE